MEFIDFLPYFHMEEIMENDFLATCLTLCLKSGNEDQANHTQNQQAPVDFQIPMT